MSAMTRGPTQWGSAQRTGLDADNALRAPAQPFGGIR